MATAEPTRRSGAARTGAVAAAPDAAKQPEGSGSREGRTLNVLSHGFLMLWALMAAGPLIWAAISSLKTDGQILDNPWSLPSALNWGNWERAWTGAHIGQYTLNSLVVVVPSVLGTMLLGSMSAYVIARFDFPGNRFVHYLFIGGMAFPVIMAIVPLFFVMKNLSLLNTPQGLVLAYIAYSLPFTTFFMTSFFRSLPGSIAEAAMIDGASHSRVFFQVMLPMARPGLISIGIFNFLGQWNQYLLPVALNTENPDQALLTQGLATLAVSQGYRGDWSGLFAGLTIATLPVLVVYAVFQRQIQAGLTAGALR
jgi:N-acetylglucosamine transport system permease protein